MLELAEAPPPATMLRPRVESLGRCAYRCPGCPVPSGAAFEEEGTAPVVRWVGDLSQAGAIPPVEPFAGRSLRAWWGPLPETEAELEDGLAALARAGVAEVGFVVRGLGEDAAARGGAACDPNHLRRVLSRVRTAHLAVRVVLPQVDATREGTKDRIGWKAAGALQRAAWAERTVPIFAPAPPCASQVT